MMGKAGYLPAAEELLTQSSVRARSASGSRALAASVYRAPADLERARRHRVRAAVMTARSRAAAISERLGGAVAGVRSPTARRPL